MDHKIIYAGAFRNQGRAGVSLISPASIFLIILLSCLAAYPVNGQSPDDLATYKNDEAQFIVKIPSLSVEKSIGSNRIVWAYSPPVPEVTPSEMPQSGVAISDAYAITIRINYIYMGASINNEEYIKILQDTKKREGLEIQPVDIMNGKGFSYEAGLRKADDDVANTYLVACSSEGWLCTVAIMGKWAAMKKQVKTVADIIHSFQFLSRGKGK